MSLYKTANIGLSVLQNLQQAQTNQKLDTLINTQRLQAQIAGDKEERRAAIRDTLSNFVTAFGVEHTPDEIPNSLFVALAFDNWIQSSEVSTRDFDSFQDKDYFRNAQQSSIEIKKLAAQQLSRDDYRAVELLLQCNDKLNTLSAGAAWQKVREQMTGSTRVWNGYTGAAICMLLPLPLLIIGFIISTIVNGQDHKDPAIGFIFCAIAYVFVIPALLRRRKEAAALSAIVEPFGGYVSSRAKHSEVDAVLMEMKNAAKHPWVPLGGSWDAAKRELIDRATQEAARLKISDDLVFS